MLVAVKPFDCGCRFDIHAPENRRWTLCGKDDCLRTQTQRTRDTLDAEIAAAEAHLAALKTERKRRFD